MQCRGSRRRGRCSRPCPRRHTGRRAPLPAPAVARQRHTRPSSVPTERSAGVARRGHDRVYHAVAAIERAGGCGVAAPQSPVPGRPASSPGSRPASARRDRASETAPAAGVERVRRLRLEKASGVGPVCSGSEVGRPLAVARTGQGVMFAASPVRELKRAMRPPSRSRTRSPGPRIRGGRSRARRRRNPGASREGSASRSRRGPRSRPCRCPAGPSRSSTGSGGRRRGSRTGRSAGCTSRSTSRRR